MNKTIYSFSLVVLLSAFTFISPAKAQSLDDDAQSAALEMCECMNNFFNELHPQLIQLMNDMIEVGEEEAQANFMEYLISASSEEQAQIQSDVMRMQNAGEEIEYYCEGVKEHYAYYDDSQEFKDKMIAHLGEAAECHLVWNMMRIGQGNSEDE